MQRRILSRTLAENGANVPIYAIEGHNVNLDELVQIKKHESAKLYKVVYRLGLTRQVIVSAFRESTPDFRTLIFVNPDNPSKTIGIPIMNIFSCEVVN